MIYFIRPAGEAGPVKVGATKRPVAKRLREMQRHSPVPLELAATAEGDFVIERRLHILLAAHHLYGEWFAACPLVDSILAHAVAGTLDQVDLPPSGVCPFRKAA